MYYHRLGNITPKRHTQFRQPDGSLYKEELVSSEGFSGIYSNLYHIHPPTRIKAADDPIAFGPTRMKDYTLRHIHLNTSNVTATGQHYLSARKVLLMNHDCAISICSPRKRTMDYFYKNAEGDEVLFIHDGKGTLTSQFGKLDVRQGDYIVIPRTVIYKIEFEAGPLRGLIIEAASPGEPVKRYRNQLGQFLDTWPNSEPKTRLRQKLVTTTTRERSLI